MDFTNFIADNMAILVPVLWILGVFLKRSKVQDYFIPWILVLISLGLSIWMNGIKPDSVI